jgi:hypothetical protein
MNLEDVLNSLGEESAPTEKVAAAEESGNSTKLSEALSSAISELTASQTKVAAAPSSDNPVADITKIASRIANAEQTALVKEAELYGAAVCDGFVARMNKYQEAGGVKTASAGPVSEQSFTKFASDNPALVKQAMELGYRETKVQLEKVASDAFEQGYTKTAAAIKTAAEDCAVRGFNRANGLLAQLGD